MIVLTSQEGHQLKSFPGFASGKIGFDSIFGFISDQAIEEKLKYRKKKGLNNERSQWLFSFDLNKAGKDYKLDSAVNCQIKALGLKEWLLESPIGSFRLLAAGEEQQLLPHPIAQESTEAENSADRSLKIASAILFIAALLFVQFYRPVKKEEVVLPVEVIEAVEQKTVKVQPISVSVAPMPVQKETATKPVENRAIKQNLGFLGLLGDQKMKKALGGINTLKQNTSAGAGEGQQGSGGELLVGLGKGVKKTTVGNSGVSGLGGIGTKGAGGGQGGYGNVSVASGEGAGISSIAVSQGMMVSGGLDYNAVAATIAKYINQVRDCYEKGLLKEADLQGTVTTNFEISKTGMLNYSRVGKTSLNNAMVEGCITTRMMTWQFPKPRGDVNVRVSYPFLLKPSKI
jgi:hypothetical protein